MKKYLVISHHGKDICLTELFASKRDAYSLYAFNLLWAMRRTCEVDKLDSESYENIFLLGSLSSIEAGLEQFMEKYKNDNRFEKTANGYFFCGISPYYIEVREIKEN